MACNRDIRVLLVDGSSEFGGQQVHVLQLATGLPSPGLSVGLSCPNGPLAERARKRGVPTYVERFSSPFDVGTSRAIATLIRGEGFNFVHTHGTRAGVIGRIAARMAGVPCVHTAHIMAADIVHGKGMCTALKRVAYSFIEARLAKLTTIIICVSDGLRQKHLQRGVPEDKLTVIHNSTVLPDGVTEEAKASARTDLGVDADAKVVGTVARLCPGKGIDCLMKAAVEVCRKRPEAVFLVAGDGDLRPDFELAAENLGLGDRFRFLGFREDVHKVFLASDVFSLPSWGEGHPLSVLEAMAFARPVVATRVAGIVEAVTDGVTGLLVPRDGAADLAEAVLRLLDSPDDAGEMGRMGRIKVEAEFSIARTLEATRAVYRRITASG